MRRLQPDNYKKLMPLRKIAEASSYSFGYVSILVQRKKLKAKKIGNKYYSTEEWMDQYLELHARDEKKLPEEVIKELSSNPSGSLYQGGGNRASESVASAKLKNQIDNLVERAIKEKFATQARQEKIIFSAIAKDKDKEERKWIAGQARDGRAALANAGEAGEEAKKLIASSAAAEVLADKEVAAGKLAEILNNKIISSGASIVADFVEPETRLEIKWQENLNQEAKDLLKRQSAAASKIKAEARIKALAALKQKIKAVISAALLAGAITEKKFAAGMAKKAKLPAMAIAAAKEKIKPALTFRPRLLKTAAITLIIALAVISLNRFAPGTAAGFSRLAGKTFSGTLSQARELANRGLISKYLTRAGEPIKKASLAKFQFTAGALRVFNGVKKPPESSNVIIPGGTLAAKAKTSIDNLLLSLADSLSAASLKFENNLKRRNQILAASFGRVKEQALSIAGFLNYQGASIGELAFSAAEKFNPLNHSSQEGRAPTGAEQGRVAGAAEASNNYQPMSRLLALANTTSRRGREVLNQVKYNTANVLENTAVRQKELSLNLGRKLAKLTLTSAAGVGLISQTGQIKLARLENTISQTNDSINQTGRLIQEYNDSGQKYLTSEAGRSLWSLGNLYEKFIDYIIPDSLKNKYASLYQTPPTIIERETIIKETTVVNQGAAPVSGGQGLLRPDQSAGARDGGGAVVITPSNSLSITGNANIGGYLNVSGPATLKDKLTVLGPSEFLGDLVVNAALTAKTLLVTDYAQFAGPINAGSLTANSLTARDSLTVVGGSFIGGNELIGGNLAVSGTFSAGHTEFPSLGVTGPLGAQSLSAGSGGLSVDGNAYLNGDSNLISGAVTLNNILHINQDGGSALTVGDGSTDTFAVDTHNDIVTISARLNLTGNLALTGDLDLTGALDLDVASTSAFAIGDGADDNLSIDTISDIITLGYASTTDQININAKQLALNFASSTAGLLINYDGTGNIMQVLDNGANRFTMADYGVTSLTASSTAGTALTITQNGAGDILNLFDGANQALTIVDGGNVGIGTTTPSQKLDIYNGHIQLSDGYWLGWGPDNGIYGNDATDSLYLQTGGISRVFIKSDGNVGIGTTTPSQKLSLYNASADTALSFGDDNTTRFTMGTDYSDSSKFKLSASAALGTSDLVTITTAGNVGIGTTSPLAKLSIKGAGAATGRLLQITDSGDVEKITILDNGNVGLGTSSPSAVLAVAGSGYFTGNLTAAGTAGLLLTGADSDIMFYGAGNHDISAAEGILRIGSNTIIGNIQAMDDTVDIGTPAVRFDKIYANEVNATTLVGVLSAGNLAAETFTINADNLSADQENSYLTFERGSVTPNAMLIWNAATSSKRFEFNQPVYIQDASHTSATSTLFVQGWVGQTADIFRLASSSDLISPYLNVTGAGKIGIASSSPWGLLSVNANGIAAGAPQFVVGSSTGTNLIIKQNGNVGIGTISPDYKLEVESALDVGLSIKTTGTANGANLHLQSGDGTTSGRYAYMQLKSLETASQIWNVGMYGEKLFTIRDGSTAFLTIENATGNVGIGTTTPSQKLSLYNASADTALSFGDDNTTRFTMGTDYSDSSKFKLSASAALGTSDLVTITTAGNVGIGTTGPGKTLDVYGTAHIGSSVGTGSASPLEIVGTDGGLAITASNTDAGTESYVAGFIKDASGNYQKVGADAFQWTDNNVTDGYASWNIHNTAFTGGITNDYFGLATWAKHGAAFFPSDLTSSSAPGLNILKINGDAYITGNIGVGGASTGKKLYVVGEGTFTSDGTDDLGLTPRSILSIFNAGSSKGLYFGYDNSENLGTIYAQGASNGISFWSHNGVSWGERMRIHTTGNVGIGTTSPFALLSVAGNGFFNGNLTAANITATGTINIIGLTTLGNASTTQLSVSNTAWFPGSGIWNSAGNVGIGTTTPNLPLVVRGTNSGIARFEGNAASAYVMFTPTGYDEWRAGAGDVNINDFGIRNTTRGATAISITGGASGGNVGIGTTEPGSALEVRDNTAQIEISNPDTGGDDWYLASTDDAWAAGGGKFLITPDGGSANARLAIDSTGNVGIGTTSPSKRFHVVGDLGSMTLPTLTNTDVIFENNGASVVSILGTSFSSLYFGDSASESAGAIDYVHSSDTMAFSVSGSNVMNIKSGNVGIGTTSPLAKLSIKGAGAATGRLLQITDSGDVEKITILDNGNVGLGTTAPDGNLHIYGVSPYLRFTDSSDGSTAFIQKIAAASGGLRIYDGTDYSVYFKSGNVGIGTTGPGAPLEVYKSFDGMSFTTVNNPNAGSQAAAGVKFISDGGYAQIYRTSNAYGTGLADNLIVQDTGGGDILFYGAGETMRLKNDGNVGIGTTAPGAPLHIKNPTAIGEGFIIQGSGTTGVESIGWLSFYDSDGATRRGYFGDASGTNSDLYLQAETGLLHLGDSSGALVMNLNAGNVGIGTTDPQEKLSVKDGNILIGKSVNQWASFGSIQAANDADPTTYKVAAAIDFIRNEAGDGRGGDIYFKTNALGEAGATTKMVINGNGNVGIGTTNPGTALEVNGTITATAINLQNSNQINTINYNGQDSLVMNYVGYAGGTTQFRDFGIYDGKQVMVLNVDGSAHQVDVTGALTTTGNVGIGTTAPFSKLQIGSPTGANTNINSNEANIFGTYSDTRPTLNLFTTNSATADYGASIAFSGETSATTPYMYGKIKGASETGSGYAGYLSFFTTTSGSAVTERVRIDSLGNVGIGTTGPDSLMHIAGSGGYTKGISLTSSGNQYVHNYIYPGASSPDSLIIQFGDNVVGDGYKMHFQVGDPAGTPTKIMTLQDNGNVGIGTTGPSNLLHLSSASGFARIRLDSGAAGTNNWGIMPDSGPAGLSIYDYTNGVARLFIKNDGNVGIGTTEPAMGLDVKSDNLLYSTWMAGIGGTGTKNRIFFGSESSYAQIGALNNGATGWSNLVLQRDGGNVGIGVTNPTVKLFVAGGYGSGDAIIGGKLGLGGAGGNNAISIYDQDGTGGLALGQTYYALTAPVNGMIIEGNVGIGTTGPEAKLHVSGGNILLDNNQFLEMTRNSGDLNIPVLGITTGTDILTMKVPNSAAAQGLQVINTNGDNLVTILGNGNVGIGTTNPGAKLEVSKNYAGTYDALILDNTNTTVGQLAGTRMKLGSFQFEHTDTYGSSDHLLRIGYSTNNSLVIQQGGNVGIGTTAPGAPLHIKNPTAIGEGFIIQGSGTTGVESIGWLSFYDSDGATRRGYFGDASGTNSDLYLQAETGLLHLGDSSGALVMNLNAGNVGIGTTAPEGDLHVHDSVNNTANIVLGKESSTSGFIIADENIFLNVDRNSDDADARIGFGANRDGSTGGIEMMSILSNGNVGIGTTSPGASLHVESATTDPLTILNGNHATGWITQYYKRQGVTKASVGVISSGSFSSGYFNGFGISVNDGSWHEMFAVANDGSKITMNGNVGIGTTNPVYNLQVEKSSVGGNIDLMVRNSDNTNAASGARIMSMVQGANAGDPLVKIGVTGVAEWDLIVDNSDSDKLGIRFNDGVPKLTIQSDGNVGIGTTTPTSGLHIGSNAAGKNVMIANGALCVDNNDACSGATAGTIYAVNTTVQGADYAEYFYSQYTNLLPGEIVCIDVTEPNAVKRCYRGHDNNVMGIVSSNPSIVGNARDEVYNNPNYAIVGMLGQVDALVSAENGSINIGDSLTSASSTPGYAMRADGGDSTVGIALESLEEGLGKIKVLISRRNKSLAVEEVEALVVERIANMKIEDQVQAMIKQAVDNLNLDPKIQKIAQEEAGKLDAALTVKLDDVNGIINNLRAQTLAGMIELNSQISSLGSSFYITDSQGEAIFSGSRDTGALPNREVVISAGSILLNAAINVGLGTTTVSNLCLGGICKTSWNELNASTTALMENIKIDGTGRIVIGRDPADIGGEEGLVQIVDITEITASSTRTAFIVNQDGIGEIADFRARGVSVMNIAQTGEVKIVGSLLVDGRIMLCTGGQCSDTLDSAVDETMADLGVEGKVVAGAFEGYCDGGYVWIPGSAEFGTLPGFCVMDDLMEITSGLAKTNISQGEANAACQSLGAGYHLIGENEWLTIAANILQVASNDTDMAAAGMQLATSTAANFKLTNDNIISSLAAGQWTNKNVPVAGLPVAPTADAWHEYGEVSDFKGLNISPAYYFTDANNYIGKIYIGSTSGLKGFVRGSGGIYGLDLSHSPSEQSAEIGFRCAK